MSACGNGTFVFGCELQGKGVTAQEDTIIGTTIWILASAAVLLGIYNMYLIKKIPIFHNSFGWFWASRTVGEIGSNAVHVIYSGPVTFLQLNSIPPVTGIVIFTIGYFFACYACVMHQVVSLNRMLAVCAPLRYTTMFKKSTCIILTAYCAIIVLVAMSLYLIIPCNMVGYSPQLYEYVFVKCSPDIDRDYSLVGTVVNRFCFVVCFSTVISDLVTLSRIIWMKRKGQLGKSNVAMRRNVRFFFQTSIQNFTMMIALTMIVVVNNQPSPNGIYMNVLGFITIIITHINNALALILFNPEVRARFQIHVAPHMLSSFFSASNIFAGQATVT
ncbi:hypothetical protein QR680_016276 [Steinernema hermaphroditum]|uniref:7TM GPCR serpentine receptor class x (Srx) domain-containing protein n=1 Tax=Steinernema hermaphroditum TaxID=289476 RepID=A0AA39HBM1_9BILA|nr:hypothetical protein QR680_016276 [Steinernema hermaphroditum]